MEIVASAKDLFSRLSFNMNAIAKNPVLPIMEDFLFDIKGDLLTVTSTNLEITVITQLEVKNTENKNGLIAVPSKIFHDTLKSLGDIPISMDFDKNNQLKITTLNGNYKIPCDISSDFPTMPDETYEHTAIINSAILRSGISKTMVATTTDPLRLAMTGVLFEFDNDHVTMVATDAFRLVHHVSPCDCDGVKASVIVPKTGLTILKNMINHDDDFPVEIAFNRTNIRFTVTNKTIYCKLIDAKYPVYQSIMRESSDIISSVDKHDLLRSLKRVALYSDKSTNMVSFDLSPDKMKVYGAYIEMSSEATEELRCETIGLDGGSSDICLNNKFLSEMLGVLDGETINIGLKDSGSSCQIVEETDIERTTLLLMPIRKYN